ncbi:hypothetical protein [Enterovibrio paralichthyis]|uniref:hypothetical protein n=1 Tax=Enterovibrio paralichthyis TaxID=2853805 RepID=UPI000ABF8B31|nr:hypothetical protein [Enterovibrio paralichthyis]MBV7298305.1 hypothetical protein [Enterovibrio paralichthyis]
MFKYFVFGLVGLGVFIGVRFADDIKEYVSEDEIEAISEQVIESAIEKLEDLKG